MSAMFKAQAGSRVTLYRMDTGEPQNFHAVDARLCLERGGWSLEPVQVVKGGFLVDPVQPIMGTPVLDALAAPEVPEVVTVVPLADPEPEPESTPEPAPERKKPGRKKKSA